MNRYLLRIATQLLTVLFMLSNSALFGRNNTAVQSIEKIYVQIELKNGSLIQALQLIERQSPIFFMYNPEDVKGVEHLTVSGKRQSVAALLKTMLANTKLEFKQVDSRVLIVPVGAGQTRAAADAAATMAAHRQDGRVSGKVVDATGVPISGATVKMAGPRDFSQSTNQEGNFSFTGVPFGTYEVTISSLGYVEQQTTVELQASNTNFQLNITLQERLSELSEVVVVAYGQQERSSFTGAVSTLKGEDIASTPRVSVQESFQGNLAGVQVSNGNGQPGSVPDIRIRGIGSINAGSQPLYVVDGVPIETFDLTGYGTNTIAGISANDIESISVLKDASSASLYGSRAANGVVLITTKSGASGRTKLNVGFQQGFNSDALNDRNKPLSTPEMLELLREGWVNAGQDLSTFNERVIEANNIDTTINTDWAKELLRTGRFSQYDINASGGNDKSNFYLSAGYMESQSVLIGVDYDRFTGKMKIANKPNDWISFDANMLFSYQKANTRPDASSFENPYYYLQRIQPWAPVRNPDGTYVLQYSSSSSDVNPKALAEAALRQGKTYNVLPGISASLKFTDYLSFETKGSLNLNFAESRVYRPYNFSSSAASGGIGSHRNNRMVSWINTNILRFNKTFGDHGIQAIAGTEAQKTTFVESQAEANNFLPNTTYLDGASVPTGATSGLLNNAISSLFFNANYAFKQKYHLSFSLRRDGSSRFYGSQNMYGNFYSVGGAWNIDKEGFMDHVDVISSLNLRVSYGENGNQDIGNFAALGLYSMTAYDGGTGLYYSQINNDLLTWEKNKPFNIGLDFGLFNNRLSGTFEYYKRITSDLLYNMPIPSPNGLLEYFENIGAMENKGVELSLSTRNIVAEQAGGFNWTTSFNITTTKNVVTKLPSPLVDISTYREEGLDFYQFYLVGYAGVDPNTGNALWYTDETKTATTTVYGEAERFLQGSAIPDFYGGFNNNFSYKGFDLGVNIFFNWGNKIFDNWARYSDTDGNLGTNIRGKMSRQIYNYRWQQPGDDALLPKVVYLGTQSSTPDFRSTRYLYDGSYIRLRDVTLAYNLPAAWLQRMGKLGGARLYVRASNLYTYVRDKRLPYDPEVSVTGQLDNKPPVPRTVVFGIDLTL
jgi:TonB-linked outer membrane protein, SusC/RagA family